MIERLEVEKPEDFIVKEIINPKYTRKYERKGSRMSKITGPYTLFLITKTNMGTMEVINLIASKLGITRNSIGYAGLKDKKAVTSQYMTIKNCKKTLRIKDIKIRKIGMCANHIILGDIKSNFFSIKTNFKVRKLKTKFLNYFGPQRFGVNMNNHKIGKHIILREYKEVENILGKKIIQIPKHMIKFYIHAYQSYLFNKALERGDMKEKINIPGYKTKPDKIMKEIMSEENITIKDFRINELKITCIGSERNRIAEAMNLKFGKRIEFELNSGNYASVFIDQLKKGKCFD